MHHDDLKRELQSLPVKYLHHMARGRIHRHFRLGKHRLVELMLAFPPDQILAIETELQQILTTRRERLAAQEARAATRPQIPASPFQGKNRPNKKRPTFGPFQPSITLQQILEGIGVPEPQPFVPDPWQTEAVEHLAHSDVIVSAPTGSGKTYVAIQAIRQAMALNQTVIYTSPLKALSNTKFMEFTHLFGPDQVGILTGDRRDNAQAPLLVMTTEILRNLFYD
ncbi:MAG: DEAD/DEAH box helicase, partial [Nitrospira sp.]|nr:DEAD/DEAH box helicase [Nitrospira sp.]